MPPPRSASTIIGFVIALQDDELFQPFGQQTTIAHERAGIRTVIDQVAEHDDPHRAGTRFALSRRMMVTSR
ncbi:hypothetical protein AB5I41_08100 [Sphingomonas sp. MMS24-JH45]